MDNFMTSWWFGLILVVLFVVFAGVLGKQLENCKIVAHHDTTESTYSIDCFGR